MTFAIEPMITAGGAEVVLHDDEWSISTRGRLARRPFRAHRRDHRRGPEDPDRRHETAVRQVRASRPRVEHYAKLLVETCVDVSPAGRCWSTGARSRGRCSRRSAARSAGAAPTRSSASSLTGCGMNMPWAREAPEELLATPAGDRGLRVRTKPTPCRDRGAREHPRADGPAGRAARAAPGRDAPTPGARVRGGAEVGRLPVSDAGARAGRRDVVRGVQDFLYGACLLDWDAERERMAAMPSASKTPRRCGSSRATPTCGWSRRPLELRSTRAARTCPAASSSSRRSRIRPRARSSFGEFPAVYNGREVRRDPHSASRAGWSSSLGRSERGVPDRDARPGRGRAAARGAGDRLQPRDHAHMKNTLFDEKIDGTVHLALGNGLPEVGGRERQPDALGHRQGAARGRPGSSWTAKSCRKRRSLAALRRFATMLTRGGSRVFSCLRARGVRF